MTIKILAFSGSARRHSFNQKLLNIAARGAAEAGADITHISLNDYPLPLYHGDLESESGLPANAEALQELVAAHDALLIASPEYNGGYTALLKNTLDWISRPNKTGRAGIVLLADKVAAIVCASPGPMGGTRSQLAIRGVLDKLGMIVIPQSFALGTVHQAFDEDHQLKDAGADAGVRAVGAALARAARKLNAA
ncbi:MAG TPA: NAD(P)H-dependent oxidoreductase [Paraburkholderia sp.]|nr:NAD(P)H-dependent oxidoreductase [Paraburkholderia sp.]